jgi:hypothetical protein
VHRTPQWTGPTFTPVIKLCLGAVLMLPCLGIVPVAVFPEELIDLSVHEKDIENTDTGFVEPVADNPGAPETTSNLVRIIR